MAVNPRNFLVNSDFPLDQILFLNEGSTVVANNTFSGTVSIAHGLPFVPLPSLVWSNDADFTTAFNYWDGNFASSFISPVGQQYDVFADATNVNIRLFNTSGSSQTVYYRIYCFAPSTASVDSLVEHTANEGERFTINTDLNYMKLAATGSLSSGAGTVSYSHGLSFVPRALVWYQVGSEFYQVSSPQIVNTDPTGSVGSTSGVYVDSTKLEWLNPAGAATIQYRIYAEE